MKTLNLHVDYIEWEGLKKALKNIDELSSNQDPSKKRVEEALVVLTAIEEGDNLDSVDEYVESIKNIVEQVKAKRIVLYPYAHLSKKLGKPNIAIEILEVAEKKLRKKILKFSEPLLVIIKLSK